MKEQIIEPMEISDLQKTEQATRALYSTSGLTKNTDGTWTAIRRVPLVGKGRMIDNYAEALVSVLASNTYLSNITDTNLNNYAAIGNGLASVELLADELVSVKDLHRTYAAGQKVGFIIKASESGLLTLDVLKKFWLQTYKNDKKVESSADQASTGGGLLKLELISIANNDGLQEISFTTTKPFDEVSLSMGGIDVNVLKKLSILYAFVGENPMKYAYTGSVDYENAKLVKKSFWTDGAIFNTERVVDSDLTNYALFEGLSGLLPGLVVSPRIAVDFGQEVPAGTEVGYEVASDDVLSIDLLKGGVKLATYTAADNNSRQEFVDGASVIGISALSGGRSRINMKTTKPYRIVYLQFGNPGIQVRLGSTRIYYAYTRDDISIDESSFFSMPDHMTVNHSSMLLPNPDNGSVTWHIARQVEGTFPTIETKNGFSRLKGMSKKGEYELVGIYTSPDGKIIHSNTIITCDIHEPGAKCNQLIGTKYGASVVEGTDVSGGLLQILVNKKNAPNMVDDDPNSYATFLEPISAAKNLCAAAIKLNRPISPQETNNKRIRAGFTLQTSFDFLSVNLLDFYVIKLYNGTQLVASNYKDNNGTQGEDFSTLGVSLIGSKSDKFRVYVETDKPFDRLELWTAGMVNIGLSERRIYNAFWESADEGVACSATSLKDAGLEFLTTDENGAYIDHRNTDFHNTAKVASRFVNFSRLLDNSKDSYLTIQATNIAGEMKFTTKFQEIPAPAKQEGVQNPHHIVGILMKLPMGKGLIDILKIAKLTIKHGDKPVKTIDNFDLADINLLGKKGDVYLETEVETAFDGVEYVAGTVANILNFPQVCGVYARLDIDGNGIPDGSEGDDTKPTPIDPAKKLDGEISPGHICQNGELAITITQGADYNKEYNIICINTEDNYKETRFFNQRLKEDNTFRINTLLPGKYEIEVEMDGDIQNRTSKMFATVHPLRTTWRTDAINTDWNDWRNWTEGSPWKCTDVIIPKRCHTYPELKESAENYCENLHIEHRGEIVGTQNLSYSGRVWVDLSMPTGFYFLLSAPLKQMVTGDMFIPVKWSGDHSQEQPFTRLNAITSPENRFSPRVYQRFWSREVDGKVITDGLLQNQVVCSQTDWTAPFNAVAEPYEAGRGFMVRAEKENLEHETVIFRFPKLHSEYTYFNAEGASTGLSESIYRTNDIGRFIFENAAIGKGGNWSYTVTVENSVADGNTFVAGNPLMCHIDIARFLETNKATVKAVKLFNGNGIYTSMLSDGEVLATAPAFTHIAPMQGFYVVANAPAKQLKLTFNAAMQAQKPGYSITASLSSPMMTRAAIREKSPQLQHNTLQIEANCNGLSTQCIVRHSPLSQDTYCLEEDSQLLYDKEAAPAVAIFTIEDGKALDINQISGKEEVALGMILRQEGYVTLTVNHLPNDEWNRWALEDRQTGKRYPLTGSQTNIDLGYCKNNTERYYLIKLK